MSFTTAALLVAWLAIAVLALGLAGLMRQVTVLTERSAGAAGGGTRTTEDLIGFAVPDEGETAPLRSPHGSVVLFSSPTCSGCAAALVDLGRLLTADRLVVVSTGTCSGVREHAPGARCVENGRALGDRLAVPATPYLVALSPEGVITDTLMPGSGRDIERWPPVAATAPVPEEETR